MKRTIKILLILTLIKIIIKEFIILALFAASMSLFMFYRFDVCSILMTIFGSLFIVYVGLLLATTFGLESIGNTETNTTAQVIHITTRGDTDGEEED